MGARVATVFEDVPGYRAGLRTGYWIVAVDGKSVAGLDLNKIVSNIRGVEGTYVSLRLMRPDHPQHIEIRVRRERVITPTVT